MGEWVWRPGDGSEDTRFCVAGPALGTDLAKTWGRVFPVDAVATVEGPGDARRTVAWGDLDGLDLGPDERLVFPGAPVAGGPLLYVVQRLLGPGGCPWDREQTPLSLLRYLLDESYEAAEALVAEDGAALRDELGDMLLQIVFQAALLPDASFEQVAGEQAAKLVRRHPHVFGQGGKVPAGQVLERWEVLKAAHDLERSHRAEWIYPSLVMAKRVGKREMYPDSTVFRDVLDLVDVYVKKNEGTIGQLLADAAWAVAEAGRRLHRDAEWELWQRLIAVAGQESSR